MNRLSREIYYLEIAKAVSMRSTCLKNMCGAVIVRNDAIISTGYNGSPRGRKNCIDIGECYRIKNNIPSGTMYEKCLCGETKVLTTGGILPIKYLAELADDKLPMVYAYNNLTGKIERVKPDAARATGTYDDLLRITFDDCEDYADIRCTPNHKFKVPSSKFPEEDLYKEAQDLRPGDIIVSAVYVDDTIVKSLLKVSTITKVQNYDYHRYVYDLSVPKFENYLVEISHGIYAISHNCVSIHGEQNAIINASRRDMIGSSMYIYQWDKLANCVRENPGVCQLCQRMIINAGIAEVIMADTKGIHYDPNVGYGCRIIQVRDWVEAEDNDDVVLG